MKQIKILGTGCPKCSQLAKNVDTVAQEMGIEYKIEKVTELNDIMQYGVMITPALVVDDQVKVSGKVPSLNEIKNYLV